MGRIASVSAKIKLATEQKTDPIYGFIGQRVSEVRRQRNMTQEQLADAIGLQRTSITNIERGRQKMLIHTLYEIAVTLKVRVHDLLPDQERSSNPLARLDPSQKDLLIKAIPELSRS